MFGYVMSGVMYVGNAIASGCRKAYETGLHYVGLGIAGVGSLAGVSLADGPATVTVSPPVDMGAAATSFGGSVGTVIALVIGVILGFFVVMAALKWLRRAH